MRVFRSPALPALARRNRWRSIKVISAIGFLALPLTAVRAGYPSGPEFTAGSYTVSIQGCYTGFCILYEQDANANWVFASVNTSVTYANKPPGEYLYRVEDLDIMTGWSFMSSAVGVIEVKILPWLLANAQAATAPTTPTSDGRFGLRMTKFHYGVDLGTSTTAGPHGGPTTVDIGTVVVAANSGSYDYSNQPAGWGLYSVVYHEGTGESFGLRSLYAHLSDNALHPSRTLINARDPVGEVGRTGNVPTGAKTHLHFETIYGPISNSHIRIDPEEFFDWDIEP